MFHEKALSLVGQMDAKREQMNQLNLDLRRSLTLTQVFGDQIWKRGRVSTQVSGNPRDGMTFTLFCGQGKLEVDLLDVPTILWPEQMKRDALGIYGLQSPYLTQIKKRLREE